MTPAERENRVYSPSQLILYDACPGAWAAQYLPPKEEPTDQSYPLDFGSLYHTIIEHYNRDCAKRGVPADPAVMEDIVKHWFWEQDRAATIPAGDFREMLELCMRTAYRQQLDLDNLYGIEEWLWMSVNGYRMRMRPDIVFVRGNQATVPDYKTSRVVMTDAQVKADFKSRCYAAAVMDEENCPQVDAVRVTMDFARYGHTSEAVFTHEDAELVKEETYWRIQQLEADMAYECTPGDWCGLCRRRSVCPALTHAMMGAGNMVKAVGQREQAEFILGEIVLFGIALDNRKKVLAEWAAHTPVVKNGMCYGPREHRGREYDASELYHAYLGTDSGPFAMLSADGKAISSERKRKKKREPGVDLEALGTEKVTTKMELYRVEKPAPKEATNDTTE